MVATLHDRPGAKPGTDNLVLVSSDTHIGPLMSQLREYCPQQYLEQFDAFADAADEQKNSERVSRLREAREAMAHMGEEMKERVRLGGPDDPLVQQMMR